MREWRGGAEEGRGEEKRKKKGWGGRKKTDVIAQDYLEVVFLSKNPEKLPGAANTPYSTTIKKPSFSCVGMFTYQFYRLFFFERKLFRKHLRH